MCTSRSARTSCTFSKSSVAAAQVEAHRLAHGRGVDRGDAQPAPGADLDHALRDERPHGLAHDRARDAELLAELALGRKPVADLEPSRQDRLEHHVRDLVGQARLARDLLEERAAGRSPVRVAALASLMLAIIRHTACHASWTTGTPSYRLPLAVRSMRRLGGGARTPGGAGPFDNVRKVYPDGTVAVKDSRSRSPTAS